MKIKRNLVILLVLFLGSCNSDNTTPEEPFMIGDSVLTDGVIIFASKIQ